LSCCSTGSYIQLSNFLKVGNNIVTVAIIVIVVDVVSTGSVD
jgi:hypothetical protein